MIYELLNFIYTCLVDRFIPSGDVPFSIHGSVDGVKFEYLQILGPMDNLAQFKSTYGPNWEKSGFGVRVYHQIRDDLCSILLFHEGFVSKSFIAETEIFIEGNVVIGFIFSFLVDCQIQKLNFCRSLVFTNFGTIKQKHGNLLLLSFRMSTFFFFSNYKIPFKFSVILLKTKTQEQHIRT